MVTRPAVSVRLLPGEDRIEIILHPGFTRTELDVVRGLPGRRYDAGRRIWIASNASEAVTTLKAAFGAGGVLVTARSEPAGAEDPGPANGIIERVRDALTVRGYSPRTRKVYLGHLRRFLAWCGEGVPRLPEDPAELGEAYILELIQRKGISKSYQNQVVSALRFLCESVLGQPKLALKIPRPRKEHRLPAVLSQGEVARLLRKPRNPKHRAILMLLYSAGLRVSEVVRLKPPDLDMERGLVRVSRGKGGKDRNTLLARRAVEAVEVYRDAYPTDRWLFPGDRPDRHLTTRSVQRIVKNAAAAAGIEKNVTAHTLRHNAESRIMPGGVVEGLYLSVFPLLLVCSSQLSSA
jgi:integrase/recombinase XerD